VSEELADTFRAMREHSQAKRRHNRASSLELLRAAGIKFESKNAGAHLIVAARYDFWPGTGLWMARGDKTKHRGVRSLIARINGCTA
jgi:hypothetical protein